MKKKEPKNMDKMLEKKAPAKKMPMKPMKDDGMGMKAKKPMKKGKC